MSYTKQTWQTGDKITAAKLNHIEDGIDSLQFTKTTDAVIFSGSVTTVATEEEGVSYNVTEFTPTAPITFSQVKVTFDGTEYICDNLMSESGLDVYGGFVDDGVDFTDYPFLIYFQNGMNMIYTETPGMHTVEITAVVKSVNEDLADAISSEVMVIDFVPNGSIQIPPVEDVIAAAEKGASITYRKISYVDGGGDISSYSYSNNVIVFPLGVEVTFSIDSHDYTHNSTGITAGK